MKKKVKKEFFCYSYLKRYKVKAFLSPFFKGLETVTELFVPLIMARIIDYGISANDTRFIITNGIFILLLNIFGLIFAVISHKLAADISMNIGKDVRDDIFTHINNLSHAELDKFSTTTLLNRSVNDVRNIQNGIGSILRMIMRAPCLLIGSLVLSLFINIKLSLILPLKTTQLSEVVLGDVRSENFRSVFYNDVTIKFKGNMVREASPYRIMFCKVLKKDAAKFEEVWW